MFQVWGPWRKALEPPIRLGYGSPRAAVLAKDQEMHQAEVLAAAKLAQPACYGPLGPPPDCILQQQQQQCELNACTTEAGQSAPMRGGLRPAENRLPPERSPSPSTAIGGSWGERFWYSASGGLPSHPHLHPETTGLPGGHVACHIRGPARSQT